ncbi:hypothetical protein J4219_08410 [Candidatus Woesearchaeota archaeon]|nr:hypothetical protein [Candidatus Woesearchaeota archaeon]
MWRLLLIALVAVPVFGQDVTFTLVQEQDFSQQVFGDFSEGVPRTVTFAGSTFVRSLSADLSIQSNGGSAVPCVFFDSDSQVQFCNTSSQFFSGRVTFPIVPRFASSVSFIVRGSTQFSGSSQGFIQRVFWRGGAGRSISQTYSTLRDVRAKNLGLLRAFIPPSQAPVFAFSSDQKAIIWFNDPVAPSSTSRSTTSNYNDEVLACLNTDLNVDAQGNPKCDFQDEAECAARGRDWLDGSCCGDAPYTDCRLYSDKQAICGRDAQQRFKWAALGDIGFISVLDGCPNLELVSNGVKFFTCGDVPTGFQDVERFDGVVNIAGHDYACDGRRVIECGGESPYTPNMRRTGAKLNITGQARYCSSQGRWLVSLDGVNRLSCERSGFTWTGSKCCGEQDDSLQSYEDPFVAGGDGVAGGCFKGRFVASGSYVSGSRNSLNYRGRFVVCQDENQNDRSYVQLFNGTNLSPQVSAPCGVPLQNALLTGIRQHALCFPAGSWEFTSITEAHFSKSTLWPTLVSQPRKGCCPENKCWDGAACRNIGEYSIVAGKGYRCQ